MNEWKSSLVQAGGTWNSRVSLWSFINDDGSVEQQAVSASPLEKEEAPVTSQSISDISVFRNTRETVKNETAYTDSRGLACIYYPAYREYECISAVLTTLSPHKKPPPNIVYAQKGKDIVFMQDITRKGPSSSFSYLWHVFDDRSMYRPDEQVSFEGYLFTN